MDTKISLALLILLLAAACAERKAVSFLSPSPTCCSKEKLYPGRIPASRILEFHYTAPSCAIRAVLVKLPRAAFCVDPEQKWFQEYLRKQKKLNTAST